MPGGAGGHMMSDRTFWVEFAKAASFIIAGSVLVGTVGIV
jgi:hypothetical protein